MLLKHTALLAVAAIGLVACDGSSTISGGSPGPAPGGGADALIQLLSNRADLISGDDALVEIRLPQGASPEAVLVELNGADVTDAFGLNEDGRFIGLIDGLEPGSNSLRARIEGGPSDSLACQRKPFSREDDNGPLPFTEDQWLALEALFADGVCDYSLPPLAQQDTVEWLSYQDAAGTVVYGGQQIPVAPYPGGWADPAFAPIWDRDR